MHRSGLFASLKRVSADLLLGALPRNGNSCKYQTEYFTNMQPRQLELKGNIGISVPLS